MTRKNEELERKLLRLLPPLLSLYSNNDDDFELFEAKIRFLISNQRDKRFFYIFCPCFLDDDSKKLFFFSLKVREDITRSTSFLPLNIGSLVGLAEFSLGGSFWVALGGYFLLLVVWVEITRGGMNITGVQIL